MGMVRRCHQQDVATVIRLPCGIHHRVELIFGVQQTHYDILPRPTHVFLNPAQHMVLYHIDQVLIVHDRPYDILRRGMPAHCGAWCDRARYE
jgi:hypothetical protein